MAADRVFAALMLLLWLPGVAAAADTELSEKLVSEVEALVRVARDQHPETLLSVLSQGYETLGRSEAGARAISNVLADDDRISQLVALANRYRGIGAYYDALLFIDQAVAHAEATAVDAGMRAALYNEQGVLLASVRDINAAIDAFSASADLLDDTSVERVTVELNLLRAEVASGLLIVFEEDLARSTLSRWPIEQLTPEDALAYAQLLIDASATEPNEAWLGTASQVLDRHEAALLSSARSAASLHGNRGRIAELRGDSAEALAQTRRALYQAQLAQAPENRYLWEWQIARLLGSADPAAAEAAYRQAVESLNSIRGEVTRGTFASFEQLVGPVYRDYVEFLLTRSGAQQQAEQQRIRSSALALMEQLRQAEIEDYFSNRCSADEVDQALEDVAGGIGVVYPIILEDRLELLVYLDGELLQFSQPVARRELDRTVNEFRRALQEPTYRSRNPALGEEAVWKLGERLYQWVAAPYVEAAAKAGVDTLVFVPGGSLRTVPPAAFYDGKRFLVEQFAVAVSPGLTLTDPRAIEQTEARALLAGLSAARGGFVALPGVRTEISEIRPLYAGDTLLDETFLGASLAEQMVGQDISIVHLATHGIFDRQAERSFLQMYDERFTLERLQDTLGRRSNADQPLELLVLSACQTAVGDERAALGLAGIALQAGARSAVASLWSISDAATTEIVGDFYEGLASGNWTKAQALRRAQTDMLATDRYAHPFYWSPFLLVGNWL